MVAKKAFYNIVLYSKYDFSVLHLRPPEKIRAFLETTVPEFIDPVFAKTSPKRSHSIIENERFRLVFAKTGSLNKATVLYVEIRNGYNKFTLENDNKKRLKVYFWVNIRNVKNIQIHHKFA